MVYLDSVVVYGLGPKKQIKNMERRFFLICTNSMYTVIHNYWTPLLKLV